MKNTLIKYNINLKVLPKNLNSILIGIILSDGGLYRSSPTANTRLEMSFGEKYKNFAYFISNLFKDYISNSVKPLKIKGKNRIYTNYRLKTKSLSVFNLYYEMFYKLNIETNKYIKRVPDNINELMDPIVLAYMIQGDGNFDKSRNRIRIYTNSYTKEEVINLASAINNKLNIYTGVLLDRKEKDQWILTIGAKNLKLLRETVILNIHPLMLYRLGL